MKIQLKGNYETREVWLDGEWLDPRLSQQLYNHSPDGFAWGYGGSGPAQLALAILLELIPVRQAMKKYQAFKAEYISTLPQESFDKEITIDDI